VRTNNLGFTCVYLLYKEILSSEIRLARASGPASKYPVQRLANVPRAPAGDNDPGCGE
jgi:hypothetical protein